MQESIGCGTTCPPEGKVTSYYDNFLSPIVVGQRKTSVMHASTSSMVIYMYGQPGVVDDHVCYV